MARVTKKKSTPPKVTVQITKETHERMKLLAEICNITIGTAIETVLSTVQARRIKMAKPRTKDEMYSWMMGGDVPFEEAFTLSQMFCSDTGTGLVQKEGK